VTNRSSWKPLLWTGTLWTADGDNTTNNSPSDALRITATGGQPGAAGSARELDRYAIAVFAVDAAGDYQLGQGWIESTSATGNGLLVKIFCKGQLVKTVECGAGSVAYFDARLEQLAVGDEIAVAVGPNGNSTNAAYNMDFEILRVDPAFEGFAVFNVADYGAAGDGSTDDFNAIHAAVSAAKE
jgi:hypothetical protein